MRFAVLAGTMMVAAFAASGAPAAASKCSSTFTSGGHRWIVVSSLSCAQALPIARALPTAAVIGRVTVRGLTVLKLRGPAGWTCATATSTRNKGAGCARSGASVTIVRLG
jgi:hypothetical protein